MGGWSESLHPGPSKWSDSLQRPAVGVAFQKRAADKEKRFSFEKTTFFSGGTDFFAGVLSFGTQVAYLF
jgi:hypothetical protein